MGVGTSSRNTLSLNCFRTSGGLVGSKLAAVACTEMRFPHFPGLFADTVNAGLPLAFSTRFATSGVGSPTTGAEGLKALMTKHRVPPSVKKCCTAYARKAEGMKLPKVSANCVRLVINCGEL